MRNRTARLLIFVSVVVFLGVATVAYLALSLRLSPLEDGPETMVRFDRPVRLEQALAQLQQRGIVRDAWATMVVARFQRQEATVRDGTYRLRPGMSSDQVFRALRRPIRQMVRLPEGWWIRRTAKRLEEKGVCRADEYIAAASDAARFREQLPPGAPQTGSLEGFLFPDTYDLPPLLGADAVVERQLAAFRLKVSPRISDPGKVRRAIIIASMVELEAKLDPERPIIAGVIENRLRIRMPLQIDATVLYALQEWKELPPGVVNTIESPYNTYRIVGLPPGPIGSPSAASVAAALAPARHNYLYYVALPDGRHLFAETYAQHIANIRTRQRALRNLP